MRRQYPHSVSGKNECCRTNDACNTNSGGEQLEDDQSKSNSDQQVRHCRASNRMHEIRHQRELTETNLRQRLSARFAVISSDFTSRHARKIHKEIADCWCRDCRNTKIRSFLRIHGLVRDGSESLRVQTGNHRLASITKSRTRSHTNLISSTNELRRQTGEM
ncbi:unannotated protein [freshwater metagenome]|uniref:Unannotated protein n=1 Tax=freshwater metagenome TaxID=449393 RepID=A0A6J6YYF1_9ZZZZ